MTHYLIYRHGGNAANQSGCDKMAIDIIEETSKAYAVAQALKDHTCYAGQFISAVAESKANREDWNAVVNAKAMSRT